MRGTPRQLHSHCHISNIYLKPDVIMKVTHLNFHEKNDEIGQFFGSFVYFGSLHGV